MPIKTITTDIVGEIGVNPRLVKILTTDNLALVSSSGYLLSAIAMGFTFYPTDMFEIYTTDHGSMFFTVSFSLGIPSLNTYNPSPVSGDLSVEGKIISGSKGFGGGITLYAPTVNHGYIDVAPTDNVGNFHITISNASFAQNSTLTIPDPGGNAGFALATDVVDKNLIMAKGSTGVFTDAGFYIVSGLTPTWGGGATSFDFTVTGLVTGMVGSVQMVARTNVVAISNARVSAPDTLHVAFTADPGAGTQCSYIFTNPSISP